MASAATPSVIIITGPTAAGKTGIAIEAAQHFNTEIISADSRQCYKELRIGVARPQPAELAEVPHHFIASHSIHEEVTAASFEKFALEKTASLFSKHPVVVMTGGTGLYIKAFCEGLDDIPAIPAAIRDTISTQYEENGLGWLQNELREKDPVFSVAGEMQNPQRMLRALEVITATGQSITEFQKGGKTIRDFVIRKIGLELPREELYHRINRRVDQMMEAGLLEEVEKLLPFRHLNALQTVGYTELFDYLDGKTPLHRAVELIKQHTRNYAKRQLTWFKKDPAIQWIPARAGIITEEIEKINAS